MVFARAANKEALLIIPAFAIPSGMAPKKPSCVSECVILFWGFIVGGIFEGLLFNLFHHPLVEVVCLGCAVLAGSLIDRISCTPYPTGRNTSTAAPLGLARVEENE